MRGWARIPIRQVGSGVVGDRPRCRQEPQGWAGRSARRGASLGPPAGDDRAGGVPDGPAFAGVADAPIPRWRWIMSAQPGEVASQNERSLMAVLAEEHACLSW
jgi:hypothetical protein